MIIAVLLLLVATSNIHAVADQESSSRRVSDQAQCIQKEREALLSFKRVVDPGNILSSWTINNNTNQNCCNWRGITCDNRTNHVIKIDFSGVYHFNPDGYAMGDGYEYTIGGEIGSSLVELQKLQYLDFNGQNFSGIPKFIGALTDLIYLDLVGNPMRGAIPSELGNLTKLQFLGLHTTFSPFGGNQMVADNFGWLSHLTSLRTLILGNVNFTRAGLQSFKVPSSLLSLNISHCLLPKVDVSSLPYSNSPKLLKNLMFSYNSMHPTAISWFLTSSVNLIDLKLTNNIINGSFPDSFGHKNYLRNVDLSRNNVGFGFPKSLGNLPNIKYLDISKNNLGGTIHDLFESLSGSTRYSLEILYLGFNQLRGLILEDAKTFPSLRYLNLGGNLIEGPFPNRLRRFPNLGELYLQDNNLTGLLPGLSSMSNLTIFNAANNKFNGTSVASIGELYLLEELDVSLNSLTGVISEVNLRCPNLKKLDLSYNSVQLKFKSNWVPSFQLSYIKLSSCKLGPRFPRWLQTQFHLSDLDISNSEISGDVPSWFSNITSELGHLNMSHNLLGGFLPNFPLKSIEIDLSFNQIQGSIPPSLSNASQLYLSNNKFSDCRPFLCEANEALKTLLDLSHNKLSGRLPDCWKNFNTLRVLKLNNNELSGDIPSSISSSWRDIQTLQLRHNNFSGALPSSLKNCTKLRLFDLGHNNLEHIIPLWIGERLTNLVFLSLKSNKFYGSVPLNLCHLTNIQILDLSQNNLSGAIPSCFENFTPMVEEPYGHTTTFSITFDPLYSSKPITSFDNIAWIVWKGIEYEYGSILGLLRVIDLSSNKLSGDIPTEVTNLIQLVQLNLSRNELNGSIPKKIGNLRKLQSLDLSHNKLSGKIPTSLAEVSLLNYLDLSNNKLLGRIPSSTQLQSFDASSYDKNLALCGPPLTSSCPGDETSILQNPSGSNGSLEEDDDGEWFNMSSFYIGIGVGFFIGFCGTFFLDPSHRFAYLQLMRIFGRWLYEKITLLKSFH